MGGVWTRLQLACAAFFTILFQGRLPVAMHGARPPEPPATASTPGSPGPPVGDHSERALQMLALLQRDGRLIDFLNTKPPIIALTHAMDPSGVRRSFVAVNLEHVLAIRHREMEM